MSIQNAIQNVLDNAAEGSYDSITVKVDPYGCSLESFTYSYGSIDDVEINTDEADIEVDIDGYSPDEFYFVRRAAIDELAELDLSTIVDADQAEPEIDPTKYVSLDGMRAAIGDLIMIRPADAADADSVPAFVTLSQAISKAQAYDRNLAEYDASEPSESETDSE